MSEEVSSERNKKVLGVRVARVRSVEVDRQWRRVALEESGVEK